MPFNNFQLLASLNWPKSWWAQNKANYTNLMAEVVTPGNPSPKVKERLSSEPTNRKLIKHEWGLISLAVGSHNTVPKVFGLRPNPSMYLHNPCI
jgi:hypothetical protein